MLGLWKPVGCMLTAGALLALSGLSAEARPCAAGKLTGSAAVRSDWSDDKPGLCREIRTADLPAVGKSHADYAKVIKRPRGAWPKVPPGFEVKIFHDGGARPRILRTAPNGDIFVARAMRARFACSGHPAVARWARKPSSPPG